MDELGAPLGQVSPEQVNYVKAVLAIRHTAEGLSDFVWDGICTLHNNILQKLSQKTQCTSCSIANVVECPIQGLCKGNPCQLHSVEHYRPCPNGYCDQFMKEIKNAFRYGIPTWQNTNIKCWSRDPWEVAKCFVPKGFERHVGFDLVMFLRIIVICKEFQEKTKENLGNPRNRFHQLRDMRNIIMHSGSLSIDSQDLTDHFNLMIGILKDPIFLLSNRRAMGAVDKIEELKTRGLPMTLEEHGQTMKEVRRQLEMDKKSLQQRLAEQYLMTENLEILRCHTVSEAVADLDDMFVIQAMKQVKLPHETDSDTSQQPLPDVKSYHDIFTRNSQACKNIYIQGDAGSGKSFFCQRLASSWAKYIKGESTKENVDTISQFSFLFYISLRHVLSENDLAGMIINHPLLQCEDYADLIDRILHENDDQCLILLDGLDEWASTETTATFGISKGLPSRDVTRHPTILTTTRPWKLDVTRMRPVEIDQLIELTGLDEQSSQQYIKSTVNYLNTMFERSMSADDFFKLLYNNNLDEFLTKPVILNNLVYVWHENKLIGNSQCEIYSRMLDFLFRLPEKESDYSNEAVKAFKQTTPSDDLPLCFSGNINCQHFGPLLQCISQLAYHTLFTVHQDSRLVFDVSMVEKHGLSQSGVQACLSIGLLKEDAVVKRNVPSECPLSFIHKTFQEFLAALYVCLYPEMADGINKYCISASTLLEMSRVIVFISGMNPVIMSRLSDHIASVVSADEQVQTYRSTIGEWHTNNICDAVQDLMADCVKEARNGLNQDLALYIQDVVVRGPVSEHVEQLLSGSNGHVKSIYIADSQQLYLLDHVTQTEVLEKLAVKDNYGREIPLSSLSGVIHQFQNCLKCLNLSDVACTDFSLEPLQQVLEGSSQTLPEGSSQTLPEGSSQTLPEGSSQTLPEGSSQTLPEGSSQTLPEGSSQTLPEGSSQTLPEGSSQTLPEGSSQTLPEGSSQTLPEGSSQTLPHVHENSSQTLSKVHEGSSQTLLKGHEGSSQTLPQMLLGSSQTLPQMLQDSSHLQAISLHFAVLSEEQYVGLMAYLSNTKTFRQIRLSELDCTETASSHGILDLTSHAELNTLVLSDLHVDQIRLPSPCPQLQVLELSGLHVDSLQLPTDILHLRSCRLVSMPTSGITGSVLQAISHCSELHVEPSGSEIQAITDTVIDILPSLRHLRCVCLYRLNILERDLLFSHIEGATIPIMPLLEEVELWGVTMSYESLCCFVDSVLDIQRPLEVYLEHIKITPPEDTERALNYIRTSRRCGVIKDETKLSGHTLHIWILVDD